MEVRSNLFESIDSVLESRAGDSILVSGAPINSIGRSTGIPTVCSGLSLFVYNVNKRIYSIDWHRLIVQRITR